MVEARVLAAWLRETDRPPLPPGDLVSWAVLTEGTLLQGAAWSGPGNGRGIGRDASRGDFG